MALFHGVVSYFIPLYGLNGPVDSGGKPLEHWVISTVSFSIILHVVTYKLYVETYFWSKLTMILSTISIVFYYFVVIIGSVPAMANMIQPEASGVFFIMAASPKFWMMIIIVPFLCLLPDISIVVFQRNYFKKPCDIAIQHEKLEKQGKPTYIGRPKANKYKVTTKPTLAGPSKSTTVKAFDVSDWLKNDSDNTKDKINQSEFLNLADTGDMANLYENGNPKNPQTRNFPQTNPFLKGKTAFPDNTTDGGNKFLSDKDGESSTPVVESKLDDDFDNQKSKKDKKDKKSKKKHKHKHKSDKENGDKDEKKSKKHRKHKKKKHRNEDDLENPE